MVSKQPRKQRKKLYNLPLHKKRKLLSARLSKELQKEYGKRNFPIRKGDKVKIMRGDFKGKEGEVAKVSHTKALVYVKGITVKNQKGEEKLVPLQPSNLMITSLNLSDEKRKKALMRK